jgi:hypothetical protein
MRMLVAAISTYIGQFFSGGVDPAMPHLLLILAVVVGGFAVGAGIIWEAARSGHLWTLPTALVFLGVVVEAAATIILFEFDEGISQSQQSTISAQQDVIRSQNDKIVSLTCENNALKEVLAPRLLAPTHRNKRIGSSRSEMLFTRKLNDVAGITVKVQSISDFEAHRLATDLLYLLNGRMAPKGWSASEIGESESGLAMTEIREGITIYSNSYVLNNKPAIEAGKALKAALESALSVNRGISNSVMPPQHGVTGPHFDPSTGFLYVAIGERPFEQTLVDIKSSCAEPTATEGANPIKQ